MARETYRFVARPPDASHQHPYLVFDSQDHLHFHLTVFAKEATAQLSASTARTYLGYDNDSCEKGPFAPLLPVLLAKSSLRLKKSFHALEDFHPAKSKRKGF